jgi:hypothetical protein
MLRNVRRMACTTAIATLAGAAIPGLAVAGSAVGPAAKVKLLTVCKHGCVYRTIQAAVNASGKNATIKVKPGTYVEGVIIQGHRHDDLTIEGTSSDAAKVVLEGKGARGPEGVAQNGVEADHVDHLTLKNLKAEHYATNGFFVNDSDDYLMKNLIGADDHSYGLYAFQAIGGSMIDSVGYGNGDSAFYIGGTPFQKKPVRSYLNHDRGYENVLGYSGTNSKYVTIENSEFYNNGAGIVPNTLKSEPYEPASSGLIKDNLVYWNNFDYYRPGSPVKTVSNGVNGSTDNYPVGAGVILFGTTDWTVRDNSIFGNFLWGAASFSDPTNDTHKAVNNGNRFIDNKMGSAFHDTNGVDFFNDGSGKGTCFEGNTPGATLDTDPAVATLYPSCPSTDGTGTDVGDGTQVGKLLAIVSSDPPSKMEQFWHVHPHPARKGRTPYEG